MDEVKQLLNKVLSDVLSFGEKLVFCVFVLDGQLQFIFEWCFDILQFVVCLGRRGFNCYYGDFYGLYVFNMLFGGYFGFCLMINIWEEKGYIYNIYSMLEIMWYDGFLFIGMEVSLEYVEFIFWEIEWEMKILQEILVDEEELKMVWNFLLGNFLIMLDGLFNVLEVIWILVFDGFFLSIFDELVLMV